MKMGERIKKLFAILLTVVIVFTNQEISGLLSVEASTIDTSNYERTYGLSYENLFELCPQYLNNEAIETTIIGNMENLAAQAMNEAESDIGNAELIHKLGQGLGGVMNWVLGEAGISDTEYEKYRYDVTLSILKDYYTGESEDLGVMKDISTGIGKIGKVYDLANDAGSFAKVWFESFGSYDDIEQVNKTVNAIMGSKEVKKYMGDTTKLFNLVVELMTLRELEYSSINVLIEALEKGYGDTELVKGLMEIKADIEADPAQYILEKFVTEDIVNYIVKAIEKGLIAGAVGAQAAIVIGIAKKAIVLIYEWRNPSYEEIQKVFIAYNLYYEAKNVVSKYKKNFAKNGYNLRDTVLYEAVYNLYLSTLKIYMKAGLDCLKNKSTEGLQFRLESQSGLLGNQLTYQTYIEACMSCVKADIDAGILVIEDEMAKTPASGAEYDSYESIKSKFASIQAQFVPNVGTTWTGDWEGASQCFGFARMVFNYLFGCQMSYHYDYYERYRYTDETNVYLVGQVAGANATATNIRAVLQQGKLGDIIQASGATYGQHTMVFVSADDSGVTVYDCNAKLNSSEGDCLIHQWTISYDKLAAWYGTGNSSIANGLSLYRATNYSQIYGDGDGLFYDDSVNFVIENGVLTKYNGWQSIVSIPDTVKEIGNNAFKNNTSMVAVEIPDTVKSIGDNAFYGCTRLAGVLIPDSVNSIGISAFYNCTALNTVVLPDNYKFDKINSSVFSGCESLNAIEIPDSVREIGTYAFYNCVELVGVRLSNNLEYMGFEAFGNCKQLTEINIPKSLDRCGYATTININNVLEYTPDKGVFHGCDNLKEVTFEEGTVQIAEGLFYLCSGIESIEIPDTVTRIEAAAFVNCKKLMDFTIPDTVTIIGDNAFRNCESLSKIIIPDNVTKIGYYAFSGCVNVTEVKLSKSLECMEYGAFQDCAELTEIEIPKSLDWCSYDWGGAYDPRDGVFKDCSKLNTVIFEEGTTEIAKGLFFCCDGLREVKIPDTVTVIEECAFANCSNLERVEISDNVITIGQNAFSGCTSLESIKMPDSISVVEEYAFADCTNLADVSLSNEIVEIGYDAFMNCTSLREIFIPKSLVKCGYRWESYSRDPYSGIFEGCNKLQTVTFEEGIEEIPDGLFFTCEGIEEIIIPDTVTKIGRYAFMRCSNLEDIYIPQSVSEIEIFAFRECTSLVNINIPENITDIKWGVFYGCSSLQEIILPQSVEMIETVAFSNCTALKYVEMSDKIEAIKDSAFYNCAKLTNIHIPDSLKIIGDNAFYGCKSIQKIQLPEGMETVGESAFEGCDSLSAAILPDSITCMETAVFKDCISLKDVDLGRGLTEIPQNTFYGCTRLPSIVIPENVTKIGDSAFVNCVKLTNIAIPASVESIADNAFSYPKKLTINGIKDSYANTYADNIGITFVAGEESRTSDDGIILESTPWEVRYTVTLQTKLLDETDEAYRKIDLSDKVIDNSVSADDVEFIAYDIALVDISGDSVQPKNKVNVKIPYESENAVSCKVYRVNADGTLTDMAAEYSDGYLCFATDHFSTYLVTETELEAETGIIYGDANGDGDISGKDVVLIKKYLAGYENLKINLDACDVNADGDVSGKDVVKIMKYLAGYDVVLGEK